MKNLRVAIDTLDMLGSPKDSRIIVLNRADAKVGLRPDDVVAAIKTPIAVNIPSSVSVPSSVNRGVAVVLDEPRGPVSLAIRELSDVHIRQRFGEPVDASPRAQEPLQGETMSLADRLESARRSQLPPDPASVRPAAARPAPQAATPSARSRAACTRR